jgi:hypothetical protein
MMPTKLHNHPGWISHVFNRVRTSSGAAGSAELGPLDPRVTSRVADVAAPEDGRTPLKSHWISFAVPLILIVVALSAVGQEMVTIPKTRLQELERKEAELEKLKGDFSKTRGENTQLKQQHQQDAAKIASAPPIEPLVTHVSPPMESLPPLQKGEIVDAMDLANHYSADAAAADGRYRKRTFKVQGEVVGFEKPLFTRDYKLHLKAANRQIKVICDILPPDKYSAVFTIRNGSELVGLMAGQTRVPITRVGDTVVIEGQCKGMSDSVVKMSGCELKPGP